MGHKRANSCGKELRRLPWRKAVILLVNVASAVLTLVTGLRENPVVVFVTGRYDYMRSRLQEGRINYRIVRPDLIDVDKLTNLTTVAESYRFYSAPKRSPENLAEDRSTCMRVNSMNATLMHTMYDDFWGKGPRRAQIFIYSISAPHCDVINFEPAWLEECIGSRTQQDCYRYILDNFEALQANRVIQVGVEVDFGTPGVPFMRCIGRPERNFTYMTDLMVHQSFWAGGSYHIEIQSSKCRAVPRFINDDHVYGLFQTEAYDQSATVVSAVDSTGWFATIVTSAYGIVAIALIVRGFVNTALRTRAVFYIPSKLRCTGPVQRYAKYFVPFMALSTLSSDNDSAVIRFKGRVIMASDVWINHWLYIVLSIADSLVSMRMTYSVLEMGTWMLAKKVNFENFVFTASALTRITWVMCLLHSLLRLGIKGIVRALRALKVLRPELKLRIERYVDASAIFMSYKAYSLLLCFLLYLLLTIHGRTTFMVFAKPDKEGVFGGELELAQFWGNEIICDYVVILSILTAAGILYSTIMMRTPYRYAANNGLVRLIQSRYVFVGWDAFSAIEALGIDPFDKKRLDDIEDESERAAPTQCSLGTILQQLYQSGPSGFVTLAADYLFIGGGFSQPPVEFHYPTKKALAMGLLRSFQSNSVAGASSRPSTARSRYAVIAALDGNESTGASKVTGTKFDSIARDEDKGNQATAATDNKNYRSLFERDLRVFSESTYGRVLFVGEDDPGKYSKSTSGTMAFSVVDALSTMNILDIKYLLGGSKKLTIR